MQLMTKISFSDQFHRLSSNTSKETNTEESSSIPGASCSAHITTAVGLGQLSLRGLVAIKPMPGLIITRVTSQAAQLATRPCTPPPPERTRVMRAVTNFSMMITVASHVTRSPFSHPSPPPQRIRMDSATITALSVDRRIEALRIILALQCSTDSQWHNTRPLR